MKNTIYSYVIIILYLCTPLFSSSGYPSSVRMFVEIPENIPKGGTFDVVMTYYTLNYSQDDTVRFSIETVGDIQVGLQQEWESVLAPGDSIVLPFTVTIPDNDTTLFIICKDSVVKLRTSFSFITTEDTGIYRPGDVFNDLHPLIPPVAGHYFTKPVQHNLGNPTYPSEKPGYIPNLPPTTSSYTDSTHSGMTLTEFRKKQEAERIASERLSLLKEAHDFEKLKFFMEESEYDAFVEAYRDSMAILKNPPRPDKPAWEWTTEDVISITPPEYSNQLSAPDYVFDPNAQNIALVVITIVATNKNEAVVWSLYENDRGNIFKNHFFEDDEKTKTETLALKPGSYRLFVYDAKAGCEGTTQGSISIDSNLVLNWNKESYKEGYLIVSIEITNN